MTDCCELLCVFNLSICFWFSLIFLVVSVTLIFCLKSWVGFYDWFLSSPLDSLGSKSQSHTAEGAGQGERGEESLLCPAALLYRHGDGDEEETVAGSWPQLLSVWVISHCCASQPAGWNCMYQPESTTTFQNQARKWCSIRSGMMVTHSCYEKVMTVLCWALLFFYFKLNLCSVCGWACTHATLRLTCGGQDNCWRLVQNQLWGKKRTVSFFNFPSCQL